MIFKVWVSRRFWPFPKLYRCKGMEWGNPEKNELPWEIVLFILLDESRVFVHSRDRVITYGPEFHSWLVRQAEKTSGQTLKPEA